MFFRGQWLFVVFGLLGARWDCISVVKQYGIQSCPPVRKVRLQCWRMRASIMVISKSELFIYLNSKNNFFIN